MDGTTSYDNWITIFVFVIAAKAGTYYPDTLPDTALAGMTIKIGRFEIFTYFL
jgi:hypothetical protein